MLSLLSALLPAVGAAPALRPRASVCNGHAELCDRTYSNVTYIGAHDSYTDSWINPAADQDMSITAMLNAGIRMLQAQAHNDGDGVSGLELCHTSCFLYDGGTLEAFLGTVGSWMDDNPNEVVTLLFVNSDDIAPATWALAYEQTGLDAISYSPQSASLAYGDWPTLGDLIDSGKRLVTFMDYTADFSSVAYIIDEFSNVYETPYDTTDSSFPCTVDRVTGSASGKMGLINHYLDEDILGIDVPDRGALSTTNSADDIIAQADDCLAKQGSYPTFVLLDFVNKGDWSTAAARLNGLA